MQCSSPRLSVMLVFPLLLLGFGSCDNAAPQEASSAAGPVAGAPPTRPDSASPTPPEAPPPAAEPVSVAGQKFSLKSFPLPEKSRIMPMVAIYLYPGQQPDSVLMAEDTQPTPIDRGRWKKLGIPAGAVTAVQTFHAGAGNYYYALTEGNQLRVFRKLLEEASPQNQGQPLPEWQLHKTFAFFTDGARQLPAEGAQ